MAELPFQSRPHDTLRQGLCNLREDALPRHPVEMIQEAARAGGGAPSAAGAAGGNKAAMMRQLYGVAAPAKMQIERQILARFARLPGSVPSARLGLESLTGALDEFGFESYIGLPHESETAPPDMHSQMETRLGLAAGTKPLARGII
ncbi:MAG: proteasome maturation factor UMP1 [Monoraphidium minutum]|nr:MAG: proteasome maturation factor UMP1 [Monoraphidium minutum]